LTDACFVVSIQNFLDARSEFADSCQPFYLCVLQLLAMDVLDDQVVADEKMRYRRKLKDHIGFTPVASRW